MNFLRRFNPRSVVMSLTSRIRTQALSWSHNTPLPAGKPDTEPIFQAWHEFDSSTKRWCNVNSTETADSFDNSQKRSDRDSKLVAVTWNVDAFADGKEARISALLSHVTGQTPAVDIIFLQEVSEEALDFILNDSGIRESWYLSEADATNWQGLPFATMTFLSKSRFATTKAATGMASIGSVWRVNYPSRYGRDALCCDIFMPSSQTSPSKPSSAETRVRLVNVHLDSLPSYPSRRPQQLSIVASFLRSADCGLVAGDFNPVQEEDATLIQKNGLVDAWLELRPDDPGFTWGVDGKAPFPPNRMDRVAMIGLKVHDIEVMHPETISARTRIQTMVQVPWSDHSGLKYSFAVDGN
jgi:tyrosyl-DNA phosphodiesterase 2